MRRGSWVPLLCLAVATVSVPALGQPTSSGGTPASTSAAPQTANQRKAQEHFQRANVLYHAGSYREAIEELEIARKLDPQAKELVQNLGTVHEKLAKYDEALGYFRTYLDMPGVTAAERAKVEVSIKRIEGFKAKAPAPEPTVTPSASGTTTAPAPTTRTDDKEPPHGRVDSLTIAAGVVGAVGLVAGTGLGIYALSQRPTGFVTGKDGSYATLEDKAASAHTIALVADISLGVGFLATLATAWLYFGRTKDVGTSTARVHVAPTRSGGVFLVGGTF